MIARHPGFAALLAGFLSATGFAPLQWWPVTLACFAFFILLAEQAPDRRSAFKRGWLFGVGHFTMGLNWIAHAFTFQDAMPHWFGYGAVVLLSLYLAVYPGLAMLAGWWLRRRFALTGVASIAALAAMWILSEMLRATLFTGFAWNPLGVVLLPTGIAVAATVIGTYGLGAIVILSAGALLSLARRDVKSFGVIALPVLALALWGLLRPSPLPGTVPIRIVQPNIGQQDKHIDAFEMQNYEKLKRLSGGASDRGRLLFWPEAAIPAFLDMEPLWRYRLALLLGPNDLLMTGGTKVYFKNNDYETLSGANNSLWVMTPDGRLTARYDKSHLVPYGEYLPMRQILQPIGLSRLVPGDVDFWPGPGARSLALPPAPDRPPLKMGVQICYEIIFSGHVIDARNRPDFLFNPSNDAWFGSWGPPQHLAQARLRAIEEAMPVIRSTPTGVSAVVDAHGRVLNSIPHQQAGYLDAVLPRAASAPLFSRIGNFAPILLALLLTGLAIATGRARR